MNVLTRDCFEDSEMVAFHRQSFLSRKRVVFLVAFAVFMFFALGLNGYCNAAPDDTYMQKQERARILEREIAALEAQLDSKNKEKRELYERIGEIQNKLTEYYLEIERKNKELRNIRESFSVKLRSLYVDGRLSGLLQVIASNDVTDFMTRIDYLMKAASVDVESYEGIRKTLNELKKQRLGLMKEKERLSEVLKSVVTSELEDTLNAKRGELARLAAEIIASEPQFIQGVYPSYNPIQVYTAPDEGLFIGTGQFFSGYSSWYGNEFHGRSTANGEIYDQYGFTCAHRTLPFGTWLRVSFRGRSVIVRVNDRGPFIKGRILDLSRGAAEALGITGVQWVVCEILVPKSR